jgi:hypothetical protein
MKKSHPAIGVPPFMDTSIQMLDSPTGHLMIRDILDLDDSWENNNLAKTSCITMYHNVVDDVNAALANGKNQMLPSGYVKIAIENGPVEIVEFPIKNGGSFQFVTLV